MPTAAASPSERDLAIAVRATKMKLGPGLMAPRVSAPRSATSETMGSMVASPATCQSKAKPGRAPAATDETRRSEKGSSGAGGVWAGHDQPLHFHVAVHVFRTLGDEAPDVGLVEMLAQ